MRVAVVGSGIAGLAAAWLLSARHSVTLFEAAGRPGGHTHTVDVTVGGVPASVDTGFLVCNTATYHDLVPMLRMLEVPLAPSDMSFSLALEAPDLAWSGTSLATLFARKRNLVNPRFLRMLRDVLRFNREAARAARPPVHPPAHIPVHATAQTAAPPSLGEFLAAGGYSNEFRDWYLTPMAAAIWSCPTRAMLEFPFPAFARFFHNHGLLQLRNRPQWLTVPGGARQYVERLVAQLHQRGGRLLLNAPVMGVRRLANAVQVHAREGGEFDALVLACHSDQALALLGSDAHPDERAVLGAIPYQANHAVLHTDASLLPADQRLWSAWNYSAGAEGPAGRPVSVHYLLNRLQPLPFATPLLVSLNPHRAPAPATVLGEYRYEHPMFLAGAAAAQQRLPQLQGRRQTWFCGAWTRYGFHEDGLLSALAVAHDFGIAAPWREGASGTLRHAA